MARRYQSTQSDQLRRRISARLSSRRGTAPESAWVAAASELPQLDLGNDTLEVPARPADQPSPDRYAAAAARSCPRHGAVVTNEPRAGGDGSVPGPWILPPLRRSATCRGE